MAEAGGEAQGPAAALEAHHRVAELPPTVHYIPGFLSPEEAEQLWNQIYRAPKPKWTTLANRRLQNWGGLPQPKGMLAEPIPSWLQTVMDKVDALGVFEAGQSPNHVLINEYESGQGILPHEDGPIFSPCIANITLGCHTILDFYSKQDDGTRQPEPFSSVLLEPLSLILVQGEMYTDKLHGIAERTADHITAQTVNAPAALHGTTIERATRVSLTIRNTPRVIRLKGLKGLKGLRLG